MRTPFFGKKEDKDPIDRWAFAAFVIAFLALCVAAGVARWSWLILDEQIQIRQAFGEIKNHQDQTDIQYERWLQKVQEERKAWYDAHPPAMPSSPKG